MKKLVLLLLVLSLLALPGCKLVKKIGIGKTDASDIIEIANKSTPTKVVTVVNYTTTRNDKLTGHYSTSTDGTNVIFEYYYEKLATPEESIKLGTTDREIHYEGTIYYKDGVYYGDQEDWRPGGVSAALDLKLNFDESLLKDVTLDEDGIVIEAKISSENLAKFIGTSLNATGDATVKISTNGSNLTGIKIECSTQNGTLTIESSYSYSKLDLFPESADET